MESFILNQVLFLFTYNIQRIFVRFTLFYPKSTFFILLLSKVLFFFLPIFFHLHFHRI
jgi:hypothetical protein